jgi:two-component system, NarL family, nitrate/nitrite response regulator NarL
MADPIRLLLADDHTLFRQLLRGALADQPRFSIVGEAQDSAEAIRQAKALKPDIVLMDLHMPGGGGVEATRVLRGEVPDVQVVVVTASEDADDLIAALRAGARGYFLKSASLEQLIQSLETIATGQAALTPEVTTKLLTHLSKDESYKSASHPADTAPALNERELEILRLVAEGASNRLIANQLYLSENTVRTYLAHILEKLGLENRVQAAAYALRNGIA